MEKGSSSIFEAGDPDKDVVPVVLVDASGSTCGPYMGSFLVFDRQMAAVKRLPHKRFRLIFWNSTNAGSKFPGGVLVWQYVVDRDKIDQPFGYVKKLINNGCGTYPAAAFLAIPDNWLNRSGMTYLYYVTDGQLGAGAMSKQDMADLKKSVAEAIRRTLARGRILLSIITVEAQERDFNQLEVVAAAAGGDFYDVITSHGLTASVARYVSYTPNNEGGYVHMERAIIQPGFVPYGSQYFSELRLAEFVEYLRSLIETVKDDQDKLLHIIQNLATTLSCINKGKPLRIQEERLRMFCNMFEATVLDTAFVSFVLTDAISQESAGAAQVFASYRKALTQIFAEATRMLSRDVRAAIGLDRTFVTWPLSAADGTIWVVAGSRRLVDKPILHTRRTTETYPMGAVDVNGIRLPVLPAVIPKGDMAQQCLRQWVRVICSKLYGVNAVDDQIIYIVLGEILRLMTAPIDEATKNMFRGLGLVMLKKKRYAMAETELERLIRGELPIPNDGRIESFYTYMDTVAVNLGFTRSRMTLWYAMCSALDAGLARAQLAHCERDLVSDGLNASSHLSEMATCKMNREVKMWKIPTEADFDYNCPIMLDDLTNVGGYRIKPHNNCETMGLISEAGLAQMQASPGSMFCPVCYTQVTRDHFELVGPKPSDAEITIFAGLTYNPFGPASVSVSSANPDLPKSKPTAPDVPVRPHESTKVKKVLITMNGTVGSGKSRYTELIKAVVETADGMCITAGTDKYCSRGTPIRDAIQRVEADLRQLDTLDMAGKRGPLVVIIDTCGEKNKGSTIFGYDFTGWRRLDVWPNLIRADMPGYMAWTLRNVLLRPLPAAGDNFWLNPAGAGVATCVKVHRDKATALKLNAGKATTLTNKDQILDSIRDLADGYQRRLDSEMLLRTEIEKIMRMVMDH